MEDSKDETIVTSEDCDQNNLDPCIQIELDRLNQASAEINRLENELDEARVKYKMTFADASNKMTQVARKRKKSIHRARGYFNLKEEAKIAQGESLKAARQYQSAIGVYRAAKETVALAEERLIQKGEVQLSSAWQEMMNHGTIRVMEAEKEKRRSEAQHQKTTSQCAELELRLQSLEKKYKRSITVARPYFELKQQLDLRLQQQKQNVTDLQVAIQENKSKYSASLKKLESISESIHEARRKKIMLMFPRQPGVGAESDHGSFSSGLSELVLDSVDDLTTDSTEDLDDTLDEEESFDTHLTKTNISDITDKAGQISFCAESGECLTSDTIKLGNISREQSEVNYDIPTENEKQYLT